MGTRAVVNLDLEELDLGVKRIYFITHDDGTPDVLGAGLVEAVQKAKGKSSGVKYWIDDMVEDAAQERGVDHHISNTPEGAKEEMEEIFGGDGWHDIEYEYTFQLSGDQIRVKHRTTSKNLLDQTGNWKDTAKEIGMNYTPFSFYFIAQGEDGEYKVHKEGNRQASASEDSPEEAWKRGADLVDNNVPASLFFKDRDGQVVKDYEVTQKPRS